jgi:hypothetical protein
MGEQTGALGRALAAGVIAATAACGGSVEVAVTGASSSSSSGSSSGGPPPGAARCEPGAPAVAVAPLPADEESFQLVVDDDYAYWVDVTNGVVRAPKAGGEAVTLPGTANAWQIALDADSLYICMNVLDGSPAPLVRAAKDGSDPVTLATSPACDAVALGGDQVFWAGGTSILRADKTTGAAPTVVCATDASGQTHGYVEALATGGAGVWWIQNDGTEEGTSSIFAVEPGGGPVTTVALHDVSQGLAMAGAFACWTTGWPAGATGIFRAEAPDAPPTLFGPPGEGLAADGSAVYTLTSAGLVRVPVSGGAPLVLATGVEPQGSALAVDESCVYWLDNTTQALMKIHKGSP